MDVEASYEGLGEMEVLQTIKTTTHHHKSPEFIPPSETQARQDDILPFGKTEKRRVYAGKAPPNPGGVKTTRSGSGSTWKGERSRRLRAEKPQPGTIATRTEDKSDRSGVTRGFSLPGVPPFRGQK